MDTIVTQEWKEVFSRPDHNLPIRCGVQALYRDDKKLYRAFCNYPSDMNHERVESPLYEACDAADSYTPSVGGNYIHMGLRDHIIEQAAIARSKMTDEQRSLQDMIKIADDFLHQAVRDYATWEREKQERERQHVSDLDAIKVARAWARGLMLLQESGTDEEKAFIKSMQSGKK